MGHRYLQHAGPRPIEVDVHRKRVGELIRRERMARGITMKTLADLVGLSATMISRYEHGECEVPPHQFGHICDTLGALPRIDEAPHDV